ncbi:sensor histidine kinase [Marinibaculum pumilum]|uniref:histidine kinase n=1 Tax=Marinibaculum pumilum TaxID=1766165 RepID=A0ABV7KUI2_9PROT
MRIKSLRLLIVGSLLVIHIASTAIFLAVAWELAQADQRSFADSSMQGTVDNVADHSQAFIGRLSRVALLSRNLAEATILRTEDFDVLERYFLEILEINPEITGIYFGTVRGAFVFVTREAPELEGEAVYFSRLMREAPGGRSSQTRLRDAGFDIIRQRDLGLSDPYDPRERPWFAPAMAGQGVFWTEPYPFYTSQQPGISSGIRVDRADGSPLGVVGADVSLASLQAFVGGLTVGKTGYAFLLDPKGRAISHPAMTLDGDGGRRLRDLAELDDPALETVVERLAAEDAGIGDVLEVEGPDGESRLVLAQRIRSEQGDWIVGAAVPASDLFGWFGELTRSIVLLALGLTLFWCLAGMLLWRLVDRRFATLRALANQYLKRGPPPPERSGRFGTFSELEETEAAIEAALAELDRQRAHNLGLLQEARRANHAKTLFLASMSHELRTPLNSIGGFAELIAEEQFGPVGQPRYREYAGLILRSNRRMLELVQQLLDLSAYELDQVQLTLETTDLGALVDECIAEVAAEAERKGLALTVDAQAGPAAWVDRVKLRILVSNLLRNAISYTPAGGQVEVALRRTPEGAPQLQVTDTGIGMDPAKLDQLREPFTRNSDDPFVAEAGGSGLGLAIVDRIAASHGADLVIETALGAGTRVILTFPPDRAAPRTEAGEAGKEEAITSL